VNEGFNPTYGARPLRRAIMRLIEDCLAERILSGDIKVRGGQVWLQAHNMCVWPAHQSVAAWWLWKQHHAAPPPSPERQS